MASPHPYEVEPRPRNPATPVLSAILLLVGGGLGAYGFGTSAHAAAPSAAVVIGFIFVVVGLIS